MKKFLVRFMYVLIPILVGVIGLEIYLRDNLYHKKADFAEKNKEKIEVLVFGTSQVANGINPLNFDKPTANLALPTSSLELDYRLFKKYQPHMPQLKVVLVELSQGYIEKPYIGEFNKKAFVNLHFGIKKGKRELSDYFLFYDTFNEALLKLYTEKISHKKVQYNEAGFPLTPGFSLFGNVNHDSIKIQEMKSYIDRTFTEHNLSSDEFNQFNQKVLSQWIKDCQKSGIKLIFFSTPKYKIYNQRIMKEHAIRRQEFLKKHPEIELWNDEKIYENQPDFFLDLHHLAPKGAEKYTTLLNERVNNL